MRNASGHQGENERRWKKSEPEHIQHFLHKTCSWKFHVAVGQNNGEKIYKKVCCTCKIVFFC